MNCMMSRQCECPLLMSTMAVLSEWMVMIFFDHLWPQRIAAMMTGYIS